MKNMRKNAFEGDIEQLILDAINDRSDENITAPSHPPQAEKINKEKSAVFGTIVILVAILGGIAGLTFYFTNVM